MSYCPRREVARLQLHSAADLLMSKFERKSMRVQERAMNAQRLAAKSMVVQGTPALRLQTNSRRAR